jgi:hypothetical protein
MRPLEDERGVRSARPADRRSNLDDDRRGPPSLDGLARNSGREGPLRRRSCDESLSMSLCARRLGLSLPEKASSSSDPSPDDKSIKVDFAFPLENETTRESKRSDSARPADRKPALEWKASALDSDFARFSVAGRSSSPSGVENSRRCNVELALASKIPPDDDSLERSRGRPADSSTSTTGGAHVSELCQPSVASSGRRPTRAGGAPAASLTLAVVRPMTGT